MIMLRYLATFFFFSILLSFQGCRERSNVANIPEGAFWVEQATQDILDPWTQHARDTAEGAFHTFLDRQWEPYKGYEKYPGMLSRHIYSYSTGYLLTGRKEYLRHASRLVDYLIQHGWDRKYGGWYNALNRQGRVVDSTKDGFLQPYAITGLAMYYFVTHDPEILDYIERSNRIMQEHAWDSTHGGYYRSLHRDLSVENSDKDFSPQLAPVSGYLIYLYLATRDQAYLKQMEQVMGLVNIRMSPPDEPWVLERFDRSWNDTHGPRQDSTELNTGHNAEVVWMWLRLYQLTGKAEYLEQAMDLQEPLYQYGFENRKGVWFHRIGLENPSLHNSTTPWWIQAYGNMLSLCLYHQTEQDQFLKAFRRGAEFWNRHFIDDQYGGAYLSVGLEGNIHKGAKAVRTKTSYHSMEHGLLNYLGSNLWIHGKPVTLHFSVHHPEAGGKLYPLPLETDACEIQRVKINGEKWEDFDPAEKFIRLPASRDLDIQVTLAPE
jgi:mannose/cellobiose epimerase-like protein (N-acyl-D-glucosamine 2-epimerase family)